MFTGYTAQVQAGSWWTVGFCCPRLAVDNRCLSWTGLLRGSQTKGLDRWIQGELGLEEVLWGERACALLSVSEDKRHSGRRDSYFLKMFLLHFSLPGHHHLFSKN